MLDNKTQKHSCLRDRKRLKQISLEIAKAEALKAKAEAERMAKEEEAMGVRAFMLAEAEGIRAKALAEAEGIERNSNGKNERSSNTRNVLQRTS